MFYGPLFARTFFVCLRVKKIEMIMKDHNWSIIKAPKKKRFPGKLLFE